MITIGNSLYLRFDTLEEGEIAKKLLAEKGYDFDEPYDWGMGCYNLQVFGSGHLSEKSTVALINNDLGLANLKTDK